MFEDAPKIKAFKPLAPGRLVVGSNVNRALQELVESGGIPDEREQPTIPRGAQIYFVKPYANEDGHGTYKARLYRQMAATAMDPAQGISDAMLFDAEDELCDDAIFKNLNEKGQSGWKLTEDGFTFSSNVGIGVWTGTWEGRPVIYGHMLRFTACATSSAPVSVEVPTSDVGYGGGF